MNGPQHYAEAERLLGEVSQYPYGSPESLDMHAAAYTHATLAGVAGHVEALLSDNTVFSPVFHPETEAEWRAAIAPAPAPEATQ